MLITRHLWPVLLHALLLSTHAAASPSERELALNYEVPPSCPDEAHFRAELAWRVTHRLRFIEGNAGTRMRVLVREEAGGFDAAVSLFIDDAAPSERAFHTSTCEQAVQALALVAALAIDPNASISVAPPNAPIDAAAGPPVAVEAEPPQQQPEAVPPTAPESPAPTASVEPSPSPAVPDTRPHPFELALVSRAALGPAPKLLFAGGARLAYDPVSDAERRLAPRFALAALAAQTGVVGARPEQARFTWIGAAIEACPLVFGLAPRLTFRPCLSAEVGALQVRGRTSAVSHPQTALRPWAALGVSPALRYSLGRVHLELGASLLGVLTRYRFVFESPLSEVHAVPLLEEQAHLAAGVAL